MSAPIRTLVATDGQLDQRTLTSILDDPGIEVVGVLEQQGDLRLRAGLDADALLVACNGHTDVALAYVAEATRDRPDLPVVVVSGNAANRFLHQAFDTGADDVVVLDDSAAPGADAFFALQKAVVRRTGASGPGEEGPASLVCVLGPKGGTGKTLTTVNLGVALAESGYRVAAVDLDLQFGDLGLALGVQPERTIFHLATSGGSLDENKVDAYLNEHESGLRVLVAPTRPEEAAAVTPDFLRGLYGLLRNSFDFIVVDTPPGFTPEVIATIDSSTDVCMVGMLDAPSLKNSRLGLDTLELMGYPNERVTLLLNRADSHVGITLDDARAVLGRAPDILVPSNRDIVRAVNLGEPIVRSSPRSDAAKAFKSLATVYTGATAPTGAPKRRGRIFGRS